MHRRAAGFTLLEMMITITIVGVLSMMALSSFKYLSSTTRVKSAATDLYLSMIKARNEAVKRNRLVSVTRNAAGWQAGWQTIADQNNDGAFGAEPNDRLIGDAGTENRITICAAAASGACNATSVNSVVFLPSGRTQNGATPYFTVTSKETTTMKRCIKVDITGKPYVSDPGTGNC